MPIVGPIRTHLIGLGCVLVGVRGDLFFLV